uniref:Uncharacterized protein n=1 Tax=Chelydra serpentina TaxID=8475 RepID=A0A8C3T347_CHESE
YDQKSPPSANSIYNPSYCWYQNNCPGMFPQEFIISFHKCVKISKLTLQCYLVRSLRIEKSLSKDPVDFEVCTEKDLQYTKGALQTEEFSLPAFQASYLRFIIKSAFDHFVSVHTVIEKE